MHTPHFSIEFWTVLVTFLNLTSAMVWPNFQAAQPTRLWEERALAGFIHLKATLGTKDTFSIADMKKMSGKVKVRRSLIVSLVYKLVFPPVSTL